MSLIFPRFLCAAGVLGTAFWAYSENYNTHDALRAQKSLRSEIAALGDELNILNAEWAYLNRPDRLKFLSNLVFDSLELIEVTTDDFGWASEIPYPTLSDVDQIGN